MLLVSRGVSVGRQLPVCPMKSPRRLLSLAPYSQSVLRPGCRLHAIRKVPRALSRETLLGKARPAGTDSEPVRLDIDFSYRHTCLPVVLISSPRLAYHVFPARDLSPPSSDSLLFFLSHFPLAALPPKLCPPPRCLVPYRPGSSVACLPATLYVIPTSE